MKTLPIYLFRVTLKLLANLLEYSAVNNRLTTNSLNLSFLDKYSNRSRFDRRILLSRFVEFCPSYQNSIPKNIFAEDFLVTHF